MQQPPQVRRQLTTARLFVLLSIAGVGTGGAMLSAPATAAAWQLSGTAIYIDDGDTVSILSDDRQQTKVRLASIDAPETSHTSKQTGRVGQPYADKARQYLANQIKGQVVQGTCFEQDRYGRSVCELFVNGTSVNRAMVSAGLAWANVAAHGRYLRDKGLPVAESHARAEHRGLWADPSPVPPWVWRDSCWKQSVCPTDR